MPELVELVTDEFPMMPESPLRKQSTEKTCDEGLPRGYEALKKAITTSGQLKLKAAVSKISYR